MRYNVYVSPQYTASRGFVLQLTVIGSDLAGISADEVLDVFDILEGHVLDFEVDRTGFTTEEVMHQAALDFANEELGPE